MDDRYDAYCAADPLFYDTPVRAGRSGAGFAAADRPVPLGWQRQELGEWLSYAPPDPGLPDQGWKVHVSACPDNAERVLAAVFDYCLGRGLPFKFLRGPAVLLLHNAKYAGRASSGKFVTVYPRDEPELAAVCADLAAALAGEPGPYILSDLRIGAGPVYVRYGAFASRFCRDRGEVVPAVADPAGTLVPDRRAPVFTVPPWVTPPGFLAPHLAARAATRTADLPYRIEKVMHFSNGGGLYAATDTRTGEPVVLKEARPYAGLDATGADAVTRLAREKAALDRLAGLPQVPRVRDYFPWGEHRFLALERVTGQPLNRELVERHPLVGPDQGAAARARYTDWALAVHAAVAEAVAAVHARGLVHGDLHLFNLLVRPDRTVTLVDFEVAGPADRRHRPGLRNQGFAAPPDRAGPEVDRYALACLGLALFLPLTALLRLAPAAADRLAAVIATEFPVPAAFLTGAVAVIRGGGAGSSSGPTGGTPGPEWDPGRERWPALRDRLAGAVIAAATPHRPDRLFPGDIAQFRPGGGLGLGYGAAGVLYALAATGAGRYPAYERWLADRARHPPAGTGYGLYDGLHGAGFALARLDRRADALDVVDICLRERWRDGPLDLAGGLAGIGLNLAHLADLTGEPGLREAAEAALARVAERVPELTADPPRYAGLCDGATGPALLLLRGFQRTGDPALLDAAEAALRADLARCVTRPDGAVEVDEGWRTMPYLARGSTGIGLVLDQYLAQRRGRGQPPDPALVAASTGIRRAAASPFYAQSGLFTGRAGIVLYLAHRARLPEHRADRADRAECHRQVRALGWHALPYRDFVAFPGEQLLRLSMDLATGTAGVLLALGAARAGPAVDLPFLTPPPVPVPLTNRPGRAPGPVTPPARGGTLSPLTREGGD